MSAKPTLPTLSDDPQYAAAAAKLAELQEELAKVTTRRQAILDQLNAEALNPPRRIDAIEREAYKLLGAGEDIAGATSSALREEFAKLTEKRQVIEAAVRIQREVLNTLRSKASQRCIAQLLPAHRAMVREIVARLVALDAALSAEHDLRDELFQRDISLGELRPMPLHGFGRLRDSHSRASAYMIEAHEHGFITLAEVPEHLRPWAEAKKAKPMPAEPVRAVADADGWVGA